MKITTLRLSNFQSFGPGPTSIEFDDVTYVLGPNGSGKTAVLEALSRLFSPLAGQRRIRHEDFHVSIYPQPASGIDDRPTLWLEVDLEIPESAEDGQHPSVPVNFWHMQIDTPDSVPRVRIRLTAELAPDGVIEETIEYILEADEADKPIRHADMSRHDRGSIEVHYLPARRDPAEHISYTAASLIGRTLRAADWTRERTELAELANQITSVLATNEAVSGIGLQLSGEWGRLNRGEFFKDPVLAFGHGELEDILRQLTVTFSPSHTDVPLPFERLSDGQKSLLYISLVLAWQALAQRVLNREAPSLDPDRLSPPVHTVIALEEPENSLAPHYLGRIIGQLHRAHGKNGAQSLIATHAPTLLRRVSPEKIRFLRLNLDRETTVHRIVLPDDDQAAAKYVREAVEAFPELYFARLVVLGEGDSERIVLPRVLAAAGIAEDDASIVVVPLGGRHVNHFWRLLNELQVPHVTLLDLDYGRYQGGWGRVRNALKQINVIRPNTYTTALIERLPKWDDEQDHPGLVDPDFPDGRGPVAILEEQGVFFSTPVDLDLMMLNAYPDAYAAHREEADDGTIAAVLGKRHINSDRLDAHLRDLFGDYRAKFSLGSKPSAHLAALSELEDYELLTGLPDVLDRLCDRVRAHLSRLPE